jgi:hypothetical protein
VYNKKWIKATERMWDRGGVRAAAKWSGEEENSGNQFGNIVKKSGLIL